MVELPRAARAGPRYDYVRGHRSDRHGPTSGRAGAAAAPTGEQLPRDCGVDLAPYGCSLTEAESLGSAKRLVEQLQAAPGLA